MMVVQKSPRASRSRDAGDIANLIGQVAGHVIDAVREILPRPRHSTHVGLAAQFPFSADLARYARDFARERVQLIDHGVDGVLQLQNFAAGIDGDLGREIALRHARRYLRDVADLRRQVPGHEVDAVREILPHAAHALHLGLAAKLSFLCRLHARRV